MVVRNHKPDKDNPPLKKTPNNKTLKPKEFLKSNSNVKKVKANEKSTKELKSTSKSINTKSTISKADKPIKNNRLESNKLKPKSIPKNVKLESKTKSSKLQPGSKIEVVQNIVAKPENSKSDMIIKSTPKRALSKNNKLAEIKSVTNRKSKKELNEIKPKSITEKSIKHVGKPITNKVSKSENSKSDLITKPKSKRVISKNPPSLKVKESNKNIKSTVVKHKLQEVPNKSEPAVKVLESKELLSNTTEHINQSTVYTAMQAAYFKNHFNLQNNDITVNITPTRTYLPNNTIVYNKTMTGNAYPDTHIQNRPYDFKDTKDMSMTKNHIYIFNTVDIEKECFAILKKLSHALTDPSTTKLMSIPGKLYTVKVINFIKANENKCPKETLDLVYKTILKETPPSDFRISICIPRPLPNQESILTQENKKAIENIQLDQGNLDIIKVRKAIIGYIESFDSQTKEKIVNATCKSIIFKQSKENNTTYNTYSEEID